MYLVQTKGVWVEQVEKGRVAGRVKLKTDEKNRNDLRLSVALLNLKYDFFYSCWCNSYPPRRMMIPV